jgi:F-type H+-transporting ATPase subunit c
MTNFALAYLSAGIGAGLAIIGIGIGIGRLAAAALDGIARQPSATGDLRATMLVAAGLVEGAGLFALVIAILLTLK